jgi:hypothetical protein
MKMKTTILTWSVAAMSLSGVAFAQQSATLTMRSGEQLNAQLMDLSGVGYTVSVNGQERQIPPTIWRRSTSAAAARSAALTGTSSAVVARC